MFCRLSLNVRGARRFVPMLEALEGRDVPAAPVLTAFTAVQAYGDSVVLSGTVTDERPTTVTLQFTGAANGSTSPDANGAFSVTVPLDAIAQISATGTDDEALSSNTLNVTPVNNAPYFISFLAEKLDGAGNLWHFYGRVSDEYAGGMRVYLSGLPELNNQLVMTDADGYFTYTTWLEEGREGTVAANVTDGWGMAARTAYAIVHP